MQYDKLVATALALLFFSASVALAQASPSEAYKQIHQKELAARCYEDLLPLRSKSSIAKDMPMSGEEKKTFFELFKMLQPAQIEVTGEEIKGNEATVHARALPAKSGTESSPEETTGTIMLIREDGQWKLHHESWHSKTGSPPAAN